MPTTQKGRKEAASRCPFTKFWKYYTGKLGFLSVANGTLVQQGGQGFLRVIQTNCYLDYTYFMELQQGSISKGRTPSGTPFEGTVSNLRTIFSPEQPENDGHRRGTILSDLAIESVNAMSNSNQVDIIDHDRDNFFTPPATPLRGLNKHSKCNKVHSSKHQSDTLIAKQMAGELKTADQIMTDVQNTERPISTVLEEMMENYEGPMPQAIDITTVHAMFKTLEESFNRRMKDLENNLRQVDTDAIESNKDKMIAIENDVEKLKVRGRAITSATHRIIDNVVEINERISKLELNNNKKMVTLNGFYATGNKKDVIYQIEGFLEVELGVSVSIEDYFEIGNSVPRTKVLIFLSIRDKMMVMQNKKHLKGCVNEDKNPYYINDYFPAPQAAANRYEQGIIDRNKEADEQVKIEYKDGKLVIDGADFQPSITPPKPNKLLEISTEKLQEILKIKIYKGVQIEKNGNQFVDLHLQRTTSNQSVTHISK